MALAGLAHWSCGRCAAIQLVCLHWRLRPGHQNGTACLLLWGNICADVTDISGLHSQLIDYDQVACYAVLAVWLNCAIQFISRTLIMRSEPLSLGSGNVSDSRIPYFSCILFTIWHTDYTQVYRSVIFAHSSDVLICDILALFIVGCSWLTNDMLLL